MTRECNLMSSSCYVLEDFPDPLKKPTPNLSMKIRFAVNKKKIENVDIQSRK